MARRRLRRRLAGLHWYHRSRFWGARMATVSCPLSRDSTSGSISSYEVSRFLAIDFNIILRKKCCVSLVVTGGETSRSCRSYSCTFMHRQQGVQCLYPQRPAPSHRQAVMVSFLSSPSCLFLLYIGDFEVCMIQIYIVDAKSLLIKTGGFFFLARVV